MANKESETVSEVTIRKAVNEDLDQLVAMQTAMIQLDQELRPDESRYEQMEGANEIWRQFVETKINDKNSLILIAESNKSVVGYVMCWMLDNDTLYRDILRLF